ncbi:hypothetical protein V5799_003298 [Amblyomma americanum]|uniref:Uncharacterized protein n=1 Tax=Amblyomma americanum TaxID=6943 RepID=A0AAQ4D9D0_AMBAM
MSDLFWPDCSVGRKIRGTLIVAMRIDLLTCALRLFLVLAMLLDTNHSKPNKINAQLWAHRYCLNMCYPHRRPQGCSEDCVCHEKIDQSRLGICLSKNGPLLPRYRPARRG